MMKRDEILEMATKITKGERETQYGGPEDNFRKIAELWSAYLSKEEAVFLTAEDVAVMMILFKVGRLRRRDRHQSMTNFEKWRKKVLTQIRGAKNKYNAKRIETEDGAFASLKEYRRWLVLKPMAAAGEIRDLQRQVRFKLLDQQRNKDGKLLRGLYYVADFVYVKGEEQIVEDVKGDKSEAFQIKKKLMLKLLGISVIET